MKIEKKGTNYLINLNHNELLTLVNGLGARQLLVRDINGLINPGREKKKDKELDKLQQGLAEALPSDVWEKKGV